MVNFSRQQSDAYGQAAGFGLIELMVVLALGGLFLYLLTNSGKDHHGAMHSVKTNLDFDMQLAAFIGDVILSPRTCSKTNVVGLQMAAGGGFPRVIAALDDFSVDLGGNKKSPYFVKQKLHGFDTSAIEVVQETPVLGKAPGWVFALIRVTATKVADRVMPQTKTFVAELPLFLEVNDFGAVTNCYGVPDGKRVCEEKGGVWTPYNPNSASTEPQCSV